MKSELAHTLKSLTSKLHGPLPLTPRGSQQLLSQLKASYKEQFDRQHLAASLSTEDHADLHLQAILKNPLFDTKPRTRETSTTKTQSVGKSRPQLQYHTTKALDAFRERASQGTADLNMAKLCLGMEYKACMTSCAATPRQAMQTSGAGSTILQWLWSSGTEDTGIFLCHTHFANLLVTFLIAEGQQSRISRWIQRCRLTGERPFLSIAASDANRMAMHLFGLLIRQETRFGDGLESAINLFIRTVADLRSVGFEGQSMSITSKHAAWELVAAIVVLHNSSEPQPPIFHAFAETVRSICPNTYLDAYLSVYIQKMPDPQPALTWFQSREEYQVTVIHALQRPSVVLLGLRAAELLVKDGLQKEALWIMEFLQTNFNLELGLPESSERRAKFRPSRIPRFNDPSCLLQIEEKNLQLLDTLAVH